MVIMALSKLPATGSIAAVMINKNVLIYLLQFWKPLLNILVFLPLNYFIIIHYFIVGVQYSS